MKRYSQNNEQDIILKYFGADRGTFLDLGANDGETLSNTRALALGGWSGVLVEPSPSAFAKLHHVYRNAADIECHQVALCTGNGMSILHESGEHLHNGDTALLSTMVEAEMERWVSTNTRFSPTTVECVTFEELLSRTRFDRFDMITLDIEGLDYEVLTQIDLTAVGCRMLIVEVNDRDPSPYVTYCAEHGMRAITRTPENLLFVR